MTQCNYREAKPLVSSRRTYAKDLQQRYEQATKSLLDELSSYKRYAVTITPKNPGSCIAPNELISDVFKIYNILVGTLSTNSNRDRFPRHLKPILLLGLDTEGSKGSGASQRNLLREAEGRPIRNLHAHGFLLLNPNTRIQPDVPTCRTFGTYEMQSQLYDEEHADRGVAYAAKSIGSSQLILIDLSQMYLFFDKTRDHVTPEEISQLREQQLTTPLNTHAHCNGRTSDIATNASQFPPKGTEDQEIQTPDHFVRHVTALEEQTL